MKRFDHPAGTDYCVRCAVTRRRCTADNPHNTPDNPNRTGQPLQDAESQPSEPAGFQSPGFANAEQHYAGSELNPNRGNTDKAVSQYDVAAFQFSNRGPGE